MNTKRLLELNEILLSLLQGFKNEIETYEDQYQLQMGNDDQNVIGKKKSIETRFDQIYEIVRRNELIVEYTEKMSNTISEYMGEYTKYRDKIKNDKKEIENKNNEIVDEMMKENKEINKEKRKETYLMNKEDINQLYIENEDIKKRREEKRLRKEEKQRRIYYKLKIVLVGDSRIAKTSLMNRYVQNELETIGFDFNTKIIQSHGKNVQLNIVCFFFIL